MSRRRRPSATCSYCHVAIVWLWVPYGAGYRPFDQVPARHDDPDARVKYGGRAYEADELAEELDDAKYVDTLPRYARHLCAERAEALTSEEIPR